METHRPHSTTRIASEAGCPSRVHHKNNRALSWRWRDAQSRHRWNTDTTAVHSNGPLHGYHSIHNKIHPSSGIQEWTALHSLMTRYTSHGCSNTNGTCTQESWLNRQQWAYYAKRQAVSTVHGQQSRTVMKKRRQKTRSQSPRILWES